MEILIDIGFSALAHLPDSSWHALRQLQKEMINGNSRSC